MAALQQQQIAKIALPGKCYHNTLKKKNAWGQNNPWRISGVLIAGFCPAPSGHQRNPLVSPAFAVVAAFLVMTAHLLWQHARKTSIPICPYSLRICRHTEAQMKGHDGNSIEMNCRGKWLTQEVVELSQEKIREAAPAVCSTDLRLLHFFELGCYCLTLLSVFTPTVSRKLTTLRSRIMTLGSDGSGL